MKNLLLLLSVWMMAVSGALAQSGPPAKLLANPTFKTHSSNFMMIRFHLKASDVQALLPEGIHLKANDEGLVSAGLELYGTDRVYGMPDYSLAFIFVEVLGMDSGDGTPGHWAIWGNANQVSVLQNLQQ